MSPYSAVLCPHSCSGPRNPLGKFLPSLACSDSEWPGLIFLLPWAGHRSVCGPHSGIVGLGGPGSQQVCWPPWQPSKMWQI